MNRLFAVAAGFACALAATGANALVTLNFGGKVTTVTSGLASGFSVNQAVSGQIVYDETRTATAASGYYEALNAFSGYVKIGTRTYTFVPTTVITVENNANGADRLQFYSSTSAGPAVNGFNPDYLDFYLYDYTQTAISSPVIPNGAQVQKFGTRALSLYFGPNYAQQVNATITAINVPEPASWAMMVLGFGMIGLVARGTAGRRDARYA